MSKQIKRHMGVASMLLIAVCGNVARALPQNPNVVHGDAVFNFDVNDPTLNIVAADGTVIDWQSFNIDPGELVRFVQQNAQSRVLNRVTNGQQTSIFGDMLANGQVYLINTAGVLIGANSQIDTAGLVVSTLDVSNDDFRDGGSLAFRPVTHGINGNITTEGEINVENGALLLVAPTIKQNGRINVNNGQAVLVGSDSIVVMDANQPNLGVDLSAVSGSIINRGRIDVKNGLALLAGLTLEQRGAVIASAATLNEAGEVVLVGREALVLGEGSATSASGVGANANGGDVTLMTDEHLVLGDNALVRADAATRGEAGTIRINAKSLDLFSQLHARGGVGEDDGALVIAVDNANIIRNADRDTLAPAVIGESRLDAESFNEFGTVSVSTTNDINVLGSINQNDLNGGRNAGVLSLNAGRQVSVNAAIGGDDFQHNVALLGTQGVRINDTVTTQGTVSAISTNGAVVGQLDAVVSAARLNLLSDTGFSLSSGSQLVDIAGDNAGENALYQTGDVVLRGQVGQGDLLVSSSAGNVGVGELSVAGDVSLVANDGAITAAQANSELSAERATLYATQGIDVKTNINTLVAVNSGQGDIVIDEADDLTVEHVANNGGDVALTAAGNMVVNTIVNGAVIQHNNGSTGNQTFTATGGQVLLTVSGVAANSNPVIQVFDSNGAMVAQQAANVAGTTAQIELSLAQGNYTVQVVQQGPQGVAELGYVLSAAGRVADTTAGAVSLVTPENVLDLGETSPTGTTINIIAGAVELPDDAPSTVVGLGQASTNGDGVEIAINVSSEKDCNEMQSPVENAASVLATELGGDLAIGNDGGASDDSSDDASQGSNSDGGEGNGGSHANGLPSCS